MESQIVPADVMPFLDDTVRRAGSAVLTYFRNELQISVKDARPGAIDIVTDADRASEEIILAAIRREFPDHDILTEETDIEGTGSNWLWLVDPLDGTVNFAHGYPFFCISVALANQGKPVAGMVYDPLRQETFSAFRRAGAFLNGQPIRTSHADQLNRSVIATGFPYDRAFSQENNVAEFSTIVTKVQGMRRGGSAAIDLSYVACGRLDGFWELKLKPWDMAAGMLLVEEACGKVSDRTGDPVDVFTRSIVATNGKIHPMLVALLQEAAEKSAVDTGVS